jgi:hypothetical protein
MRRLILAIGIVSWLLCAATGILWRRSYVGPQIGAISLPAIYSDLDVSDGDVWWEFAPPPGLTSPTISEGEPADFSISKVSEGSCVIGSFWSLWWSRAFKGRPDDELLKADLILHDWFLCLLFGTAGLASVIWILRTRRPPLAGFCRTCGYDLRATPDRCPECGTVRKISHTDENGSVGLNPP